ncbi:MAG: NAD(P)/FAD-dependent oxidoreductase [Methanotrichaceae archaeon]
MKCDVLVVGASPAGIMASISAAKAGSNVIIIDRDLGSLNHAANTIFEGMASRTGLEIDGSYVLKTLKGMRILSPSGHAVTIPAKGYFLDRKIFDSYYLGMAEDAGVILQQSAAIGMKPIDGKRFVSTSIGRIEAKVVVDASGVKPALAAEAGLSTMRHPLDIAWAVEATVQHSGLGEEDFFQYWIGSMAPGWKATFSPAGGDMATLGVFVRGQGSDVKPFFRRFLSYFKQYKLKDYRDIENMKVLSSRIGGDPIAVLPGDIVSDGFMAVGGAAGQSGLAYSMRAGRICGEVAAKAVLDGDVAHRALARYEHLWRSEFYWEYRLGRAALETLRNLRDDEIDRLVQGLSEKCLISEGPLYKKAINAAMLAASVRPRVVLDLTLNLARG